MTKVVNRRTDKEDVYIGRGSRWGNPFRITEGVTRDEAIRKYKAELWLVMMNEETRQALLKLDGKKLGCYCKPRACHGDVLVAAIEWLKGQADAPQNDSA